MVFEMSSSHGQSPKRVWVFLRGLAREQAHWGEFLHSWKQKFPSDACLSLDLPGAGSEIERPLPLQVRDVISDLRARLQTQLVEHNLVGTPIGFFAVSLGGMLALKWNELFPDEFEVGVVVNSSIGKLSPPVRRLRLENWKKFLCILKSKNVKEREAEILNLVCNSEDVRQKTLAAWIEIGVQRPVAAQTIVVQLLWAAQVWNFRRPSTAPILVLASQQDQLMHPDCSLNLANHFGWPLRSHPEAGHDLTLEDPEWVLQAVAEFRL